MKELADVGLAPKITALEVCPLSDLNTRERYWIDQFDNLVNSDHTGFKRTRSGWSEERRAEQSKRMQGNPHGIKYQPLLCEIDRHSVVELRECGLSVADLVEVFGVQKSTIYNILKAGQ